MKLIPLNLNHCRAAHYLLHQIIREQQIDIAILSEQYKDKTTGAWISDLSGKAAIWNCRPQPIQMLEIKQANYFVRAKLYGIYIYSCYLPSSLTQTEALTVLEEIAHYAGNTPPNVIACDLNAWSTQWDCPGQLNIALLNQGCQNTFEKAGTGSIIDLTFASNSLTRGAKSEVSGI